MAEKSTLLPLQEESRFHIMMIYQQKQKQLHIQQRCFRLRQ